MKITRDSVGNTILNDGSHRVVLSAPLVEAIAAQVYAESPRAECEGRMVVVDLSEVAAGESEPIAHPASSLPVCPSCLVPAVLESVQDGGPECALRCPKCGAGWSEVLSAEVIEALLGTEGYEVRDAGSAPLCPECDIALAPVDGRGGFFCSKCGNSWIMDEPREPFTTSPELAALLVGFADAVRQSLAGSPSPQVAEMYAEIGRLLPDVSDPRRKTADTIWAMANGSKAVQPTITEHFQALHKKLGGQLDGVDLVAEVMEGREDDPEEEDDGDDEEEDNWDGRVHRRWLAERFMDEMQDAGDGNHSTGYGAFPGGDPRRFDPDPECSTPEEREAHRVACQEADAMEERGEVPDWPSAHSFGRVGGVGVHVEQSLFGLGTYEYEEANDER